MWSVPRGVRGVWTAGPRAQRQHKRRFEPRLQALEERKLLVSSANDPYAPTNAEQYMLELINQARANPAAEGRQLVAIAQTNPVLQAATQGWNLNTFLSVISSYAPEPPLAFNTSLNEAAIDHSVAMLAANMQFHSPSGYLNNPNVARASNGQAFYPTGNGSWATGENIFAYSQNVESSNDADYVNYFEAAFLIDWGNPDFGHLANILAPGPGNWSPDAPHYPYSEIGIGLLTNVTPTVLPGANNPNPSNQGLNVGPDIVTQEFGWRSGNPILTGSFYVDKSNSGFYAPGEGLGGVTITAVGTQGQGTFQAQTWSSGGYSLPLPPGTYNVSATGNVPYTLTNTVTLGVNNVAWEYGFKPTFADQPVPGNYLNDGKTDMAVFRPATDQWFVPGSSTPIPFGWIGNDVPLPGNYNGTGHTEIGVYRPSTGQWFALGPNGSQMLGVFGGASSDIPVPGDYDGVGYTEPAIYRASTGQWFVLGPKGGHVLGVLGGSNLDIPIPGDYDGVGHSEPAVYQPSTGQWFVMGPNGTSRLLATFGEAGVDIPVPGDYDGVGHLEPAVYRPTTGQWFILGPNGVRSLYFGQPNVDVPIRGDFNGDGKADPAVYRPTTGQWFVLQPGGGTLSVQFGLGGVSTSITSWLTQFSSHPSPVVTQSLLVPLKAWAQPAAQTTGNGPPNSMPPLRRLVLQMQPAPRSHGMGPLALLKRHANRHSRSH